MIKTICAFLITRLHAIHRTHLNHHEHFGINALKTDLAGSAETSITTSEQNLQM
jgi:hypothetical protein